MPPTTATPTFDYDVFISYSSQDKAWVRGELLARLEAAGLKVIIDYRDFRIGAPSINEMERAVTASRKTLLVLTPAYLASGWAEFENLMLQTPDPVNRQLRLIPLRKAVCDLPPRIGFLTYVDFADSDEIDLAWRKLLAALGSTASRPAAPTSPPAVTPPAPPPPLPTTLRELIRTLRNELAALYLDSDSAKQVATFAGLNISRINLSGTPTNIWFSILDEAQKSDKLGTLLQIANEEYPNKAFLQQALQSFPASSSGGQITSPPPTSPAGATYITINNPQVTQNISGTQINTGGGTYVGGDVEAGGDFTGRDQNSAPQK